MLNILQMRKSISIQEESYWKLMELKAKLRADTWDDLIEKIHKMVFKDEEGE